MKFLIIVGLCFLSSLANAGVFVQKGLYVETDLAIGYGKTLNQAIKDAASAIPSGLQNAEAINSPAIQCTNNKVWNEKTECVDGDVRFVLPIQKI